MPAFWALPVYGSRWGSGWRMTQRFTDGQQTAAPGLCGREAVQPAVSAVARLPARRPVPPDDLFARDVAQASVDLLLLYPDTRVGAGMDALQLLLRAMCASERRVNRAGLQDGHITLEVDGVALAFGADRLPDRRGGVFHRPDGLRAPHGAARLGFFLYRHQACMRLRVAHAAPSDLLRDLVGLVLRCNPPKAVLLHDSRIVMSAAEVLAADPASLTSLLPGSVVPRPVARYARPSGRSAPDPRSVFDPHATSAPATSPEGVIAGNAAQREQARLRAALRPNVGTTQAAPTRLRVTALAVMTCAALLWVWERGGAPL